MTVQFMATLAVVAAALGIGGCVQKQVSCEPGFAAHSDGLCYQTSDNKPAGDTAADSSPETGESGDTGETDETATTVGRDLTMEGAFAGANVIILGLDTIPAAAIDDGKMPNVKAVINNGFILDQHQCGASWTAPCMISWAVGSPAPVLGADAFMPESVTTPNAVLSDDAVTFADVLSAAGYQTALISQNGFFGVNTNTKQGYGTYVPVKGFNEGQTETLEVIGEAVDSDQPFYVHWHNKGGHEPYIDEQEPESYYSACLNEALPDGIDFSQDKQGAIIAERWDSWNSTDQERVLTQLNCVYAAQLKWLDDAEFGEFWRQIDEMGALDNTIVLVMSDHGEEAGEHLDATDGWPNFGHNHSVYQQVSGVVSAFWAKDIAPGTVAQVTDQADIAPTLLHALGIPVPESMAGVPVGEIPSDRVLLRYECGGPEGSIPTENMAAANEDGNILHLNSDGGYEGYSLRDDPAELSPTGQIDEALRQAVDELSARASSERWCGG